MDKRRIEAAIAGLLHDVGKLEQRARVDPWNPAPGIEPFVGPVHATWTAYFCQNYLPKRFLGPALAGAYHHDPGASPGQDKALSRLIALADKLSAGERSDLTKDYPRVHPPQQMISIFDQVGMEGKPRQKDYHYLPLAKLTLKKNVIFPDTAEPPEVQAEAYDTLRGELEQAARQDPGDDETYLEHILASMQRTIWCVPSAYYHSLPDVSLYDHSRMTAALAVCLTDKSEGEIQGLLDAVIQDYRRKPNEKIPEDVQKILDAPTALLIGGDISGVQKFIYTLSSKGAAKTLRGRSFYLQLLTEAVMRYLMRALDIPATNVIYSGGGHFYLLAPLSAKNELIKIQEFITKVLLEYHGTSLYLALGCAEVPASGFRKGNFPDYWDEMHRQLALAKQQRYTELGCDLYDMVFKPKPHGGNQENTCAVCGEERENIATLEDSDTKICSMCNSFAKEIGGRLPKASSIGIGFGSEIRNDKDTGLAVLGSFGMEISWVAENKHQIAFESKPERAVVWALDDLENFPDVKDVPFAKLMRYSVNLIPVVSSRQEADDIMKALSKADREDHPPQAGKQKTFTHLQAQSKGIKRLGVLRMDVDDLGLIFKSGFGPKDDSRATLARLSTLSFQMSLFFEGWIKNLCQHYPGLIYAVYTGGDDLFLVGPWHIMPELATQISSELDRYTGHNPNIHISGGLAFIHGKYPVYQAAEDAGKAESQAKYIDDGKDGKNAFSFLERAWKWDDFIEVQAKFLRLKEIVSKEEEGGLGGPQALLQKLRQLALDEAATRKASGGKLVFGRWMWQGVYYLKRMEALEREKRPQVAEAIEEIRTSLDENDFGNISQWGTAARWAQLELRKQKDEISN